MKNDKPNQNVQQGVEGDKAYNPNHPDIQMDKAEKPAPQQEQQVTDIASAKKEKEKILTDEYSDTKLIIGYSAKDMKKVKVEELETSSMNELNVGSFKREVLENGQRVGVLEIDKNVLKALKKDEEGNYTVSLHSPRFKGDDFLCQYVKINEKELDKLQVEPNGKVRLLVSEKEPGGDIAEKRDLQVMRDTPENRKELEGNGYVKYSGEERIQEREKIMDTQLSPNIKFRDVFERMSKEEKGEVEKMENEPLKKFIEENKKPLGDIEESIRKEEVKLLTAKGRTVYLLDKDGENKTAAKCLGLDKEGKVLYKELKEGKEHQVNPFDVETGKRVKLGISDQKSVAQKVYGDAIKKLTLDKGQELSTAKKRVGVTM